MRCVLMAGFGSLESKDVAGVMRTICVSVDRGDVVRLAIVLGLDCAMKGTQ